MAKIQFLTGLQPDFHHFLLIGSVSKVGLKRGHFYKRVRVELAFVKPSLLNKIYLYSDGRRLTRKLMKSWNNTAVLFSLYLQRLGSYKSANTLKMCGTAAVVKLDFS